VVPWNENFSETDVEDITAAISKVHAAVVPS
jgi:hypothetical protein